MLCALAGGPVISPGWREMAYFMIVIDPKVFLPGGEYPARISELAAEISSARPIDPKSPVRMPFERSASERRLALASGFVDVPDIVYESLLKLKSDT